jgi:hypothetical protein
MLASMLPNGVFAEDTDSDSDDSVYVEKTDHESRFDKRLHRYRKHWESLIPTQAVSQFAGNMGFLSVGIGWDYGHHRQFETHLMMGFIPKFDSKRAKMTMTLKENYVPWSFELGSGFSVEPLSCGLYVNTVFGHEFWTKEPTKYPNGYYELSTKLRPSIFIGERVTKNIPKSKRKFVKSITAYYEFSATDLNIYMKCRNSYLRFNDVMSLSFGLKFQLL